MMLMMMMMMMMMKQECYSGELMMLLSNLTLNATD